MAQIISIVGKSNTGKTMLLEKLIPELKSRGYRIGTVKHAHKGFDMDKQGKDSWRHKKAGADTVFVVSPEHIAMIADSTKNSLDVVERHAGDMDLMITEGFKSEDKPKIEVVRKARSATPLCTDDPQLIAFATDTDLAAQVPVFDLEDIKGIADFIEGKFLKKKSDRQPLTTT